MVYDLIIVGMGPAGVTAAIYGKRAGLNMICFESSMLGGYLNYIDRIDNYPGLYGVSGPDFAFKLFETVKELDIAYYNKAVDKIEDMGEYKKVIVGEEEYKTKNVIIAIGRQMRKLGLDKEDELLGRGISRCALCDGNFYKNKNVAVVGGGNSALQETLYLTNIVDKVYLIHRRESFRADKELVDKVLNNEKIEIIYNANVEELITTDNVLTGIKLDNQVSIDVNGLFVYIGFEPVTDFISNLNITDENGYILVNDKQESKIKGIYAIGDIVKKDVYQISNAVGEGTVAVSDIIEKLL